MTTQFTTRDVYISGTMLQGYINCSYDTLREIFGEPMDSRAPVIQVRWAGKSGNTVFTIYDWKEERDVYDVTDWHIGGIGRNAVEVVHKIVNERIGDNAEYAVRFYDGP